MTTSTTLPTIAASETNEDTLYEIVNGQRQETSPMGALASEIASELGGHLWAFAHQHQLGAVFNEMLFALTTGLARCPDVAFVAKDRLVAADVLQTDPAHYAASPNLAVEVVSPTNGMTEVLQKVQEYFDAKVQRVWVVLPQQRQVYAFSSPTQVRILTATDELEGEAVLPGLRLPVGAIFS